MFGMGTGVTPPLSPPKPCLDTKPTTPNKGQQTGLQQVGENIYIAKKIQVTKQSLKNSTASTSCNNTSPRSISTGRLNTLRCLHVRPINVVTYHGPYPVNPVGDLILERVSHLDAFSGYPFRRSLTSHAPGGTTGTRELRPSRSSRTRDRLLQITFGCRG